MKGDDARPRRPQLVGRRGHGRSRRWRGSSTRSSASTGSTRSPSRSARCSNRRVRAGAADDPIARARRSRCIEPEFGGVMFGIDPVSGRADRRVDHRGARRPEPLVSGEVDGLAVSARHRAPRCSSSRQATGPRLPKRDLRRARRCCRDDVADVFGGPQDVEWAIGDRRHALTCCNRGRSRPRSAASRSGPVYGPGPVAETFPEPLTELERDLWVPPLRDSGARGSAARRRRDAGGGRRRARSSSRSTATSPSTCGSPARSRPRGPASRS